MSGRIQNRDGASDANCTAATLKSFGYRAFEIRFIHHPRRRQPLPCRRHPKIGQPEGVEPS